MALREAAFMALALVLVLGVAVGAEAFNATAFARPQFSKVVGRLLREQAMVLGNDSLLDALFPLTAIDLQGSYYSLNHLHIDEKYKIAFCPIQKAASSLFTKLFRRMSDKQFWYEDHWDRPQGLVTARQLGLKRLEQILRDPTWTKAIMFRNPTDRLVSSYHQFMTVPGSTSHYVQKMRRGNESVPWPTFLNQALAGNTGNVHWNPQTHYCAFHRFWKFYNFVGSFDRLPQHGRQLLDRIGAWDEHGSRGWALAGLDQVRGRHFSVDKRGRRGILRRNLTALLADMPPSFNVSDCIFCNNYATHHTKHPKQSLLSAQDQQRILHSELYAQDWQQWHRMLSGPAAAGPMVLEDLQAWAAPPGDRGQRIKAYT